MRSRLVVAGVSWAVRASTATAHARRTAALPAGAVGAWGWRGFASKGGEEAAAEGGAAGMVGAVKEEGRVDMSVIRDIVADPNPAKHRPGDAGKVFQLDKKELKELFPNGIAGAFHLLFYGTRSALPQKYRRMDDWWNVTLKETPGMIIRKEASHIMSALHCIARTNSKKGGEPTVNTPGFLIDGPPGSGKSTVLNHIAHWAVKTGEWIVIWVPHASDLVSNKGFFTRSGDNGEYIAQPQFTIEYMKNMLDMNGDKVSEIQVEFDGGKMAFHAALTALMELPQVKREEGAVPLFDQLHDALKAQTKYPLLVAVDELNALHGTSLYMNMDMTANVECQDIHLAKAFGAYLDAGYKRGVVVGAATRQGQFAHVKLPKFNTPPLRVDGFTIEELRTYLTYMYTVKDFFTPVTQDLLEYLLFTTAGRPLDVEKACSHEIFNLGKATFPKKWQKTQFYLDGGYHEDLITDPEIQDLA